VEAAQARGIPVFEPANPNTSDFAETLAAHAPDLFLAAGYMFLLRPALLSIPRLLAVNFHASLLPAYRGKHPVFWALRNGERQAGLTAHVMDPHFDTGDILYQVRVRTRKRDTVSTLYDRIIEKSVSLVPRLIADAAQGTLPRTPQTGAGASYFSSVSEEDFQLDWTCPAESLRRWIQTSPGECWRMVAGRRVYFMDAEVVRSSSPAVPGQLIELGRFSTTLATGKDALVVRWVRPDGQGKLRFSRLCAELGLKAGDVL
jgi:methionyl-tRNA formyltransferase